MSQQPDAIIIGTGVIGTAVAFEMAKNGWKTLSLDRNAQIGHGSTVGSCAIIRMHYSTFDGTAFAWEGYHYWRDWKDYLEVCPTSMGLAQFRENAAVMVMKHRGQNALHGPPQGASREQPRLSISRYQDWDEDGQSGSNLPIYSTWPAITPPNARIDDPGIWRTDNGGRVRGARCYFPTAGYVTDPALSSHNLADARGGSQGRANFAFSVHCRRDSCQEGGRDGGAKLASERRRSVVSSADGDQCCRSGFGRSSTIWPVSPTT